MVLSRFVPLVMAVCLVANPSFGSEKAWWKAVSKGKATKIEKLLKKGADVDVGNESGQTALVIASSRGDVELMQILLDAGANRNHNESDPLVQAVRGTHISAVRMLVEAGATVTHRVMRIGEARDSDTLLAVLEPRAPMAVSTTMACPGGVVPKAGGYLSISTRSSREGICKGTYYGGRYAFEVQDMELPPIRVNMRYVPANVKLTSSDPTIIAVSPKGRLHIKSAGVTRVKGEALDGSLVFELMVDVKRSDGWSVVLQGASPLRMVRP